MFGIDELLGLSIAANYGVIDKPISAILMSIAGSGKNG